ncbi:hypothetical protein HELRODRAFT_89773 [Helobdella robusta]|uniref:Citrate transporter-like domain-containing protein n=1 Tax=Helobdella robusta TaxID=6412 RepID=T1G7H3_HELRO|nr:hypothetical protein HELRODRAFT_89773 [Helobdella robusta]ESN92179.1 hypothetical protein HELRODRAFT_89773 [Helobdella robusta]
MPQLRNRDVPIRWQLWKYRKNIVAILTPLLLSPVLIVHSTQVAKCAFAILVMAVYWMTEVIPMAVTALLPIVFMPWFGIMDSRDVCEHYLKDANMLFFGGLLVAVAVEKWNLHKRVALRVLMLVGSKPCWIMFGFMNVTAFLSMWLSNTATTAMMIPIAHAVLRELGEHRKRVREASYAVLPYNAAGLTTQGESMSEDRPDAPPKDRQFKNFGRALKLSIAYAANIGGTATLTGTGPNIVLKGQTDSLVCFPDCSGNAGINFSSWFVLALPNMFLALVLAWLWLLLLFLGPRNSFRPSSTKEEEANANIETAADVIRREYRRLGGISFAEVAVLLHFLVLAGLWLSREPEFVRGWGSLMPNDYVTDASVAITISVFLFIIPSSLPDFYEDSPTNQHHHQHKSSSSTALLDWSSVNKQMPWGVLLLLGGGFALADACKNSGLSGHIGEMLISFRDLPIFLISVILCLITITLTTFTSNVATATIFMPILAELAELVHVHPLYLMFPVTICASFAFILPVSTPPNAIVYAHGDIKIKDMVIAGIPLTVLCLVVLQLAVNTWGYSYFDLSTFPQWAYIKNSSTSLTSSVMSKDLVNLSTTTTTSTPPSLLQFNKSEV